MRFNNNEIEDAVFFFFGWKNLGFTLFFVGLGLGPRNRIDDGFDIGKKDSVRMGGVVGPKMWDPFIQDYHACNFSLL